MDEQQSTSSTTLCDSINFVDIISVVPTNPSTSAQSADQQQNLELEKLQQLFDSHRSKEASDNVNGSNVNGYPTTEYGIQNSEISRLLPSDSRFSPLTATKIMGQWINCFVVGGECRLCWPQMLALCLVDVPQSKIDDAKRRLYIMNSLANEEQLKILKVERVIPLSESRCELITKTNAERLIGSVKVNGNFPISEEERQEQTSIKVNHYFLIYYNFFIRPFIRSVMIALAGVRQNFIPTFHRLVLSARCVLICLHQKISADILTFHKTSQ
jgi:hypothetical protein